MRHVVGNMSYMNVFRTTIAFTLLIGASALAVGDTVENQLNANYVALGAAFKRKDIAAFERFYAPTFASIDAHGNKTSRDKVFAALEHQMKTATNVEWNRKATKVTIAGNEATTSVNGYFKATMPLADGKQHSVELRTLAINVWVKAGKNWLLQSSKPISNTMTQDGKLMTKTIRRRVMEPSNNGH